MPWSAALSGLPACCFNSCSLLMPSINEIQDEVVDEFAIFAESADDDTTFSVENDVDGRIEK